MKYIAIYMKQYMFFFLEKIYLFIELKLNF